MSVMINLLPDVRLQKLRDASRKKLMMLSSASIIVGSLAILFLLFIYSQAQSIRINLLSSSITTNANKLKNESGINKILTLEQQLSNLPALYKNRRGSSIILTELQKVTPQTISLSSFQLGTDGSVAVVGAGRSYAAVTQFVKALKETSRPLDDNDTRLVNVSITYNATTLSGVAAGGSNLINFTLAATLQRGNQ